MQHIQPDLMQRFLADEVDLMQRDAVTEHVAGCDACAALLVALAAEDDSLGEALRLDDAETAWVEATDLTAAVLEKVRPWYREPGAIITMLVIALPTLLALSQVAALVSRSFTIEHPVGLVLELLQTLLPALWHLVLFVLRGGLLTTLWPILALAAVCFLWHLRSKKEVLHDA
jgi:hypothetical protein